ncbi:hypothetical protein J6590_000857 [Homalodisca vitripennis]|nr:hypothetical protein J6590_000857 [Homalodisca vitripennis]
MFVSKCKSALQLQWLPALHLDWLRPGLYTTVQTKLVWVPLEAESTVTVHANHEPLVSDRENGPISGLKRKICHIVWASSPQPQALSQPGPHLPTPIQFSKYQSSQGGKVDN